MLKQNVRIYNIYSNCPKKALSQDIMEYSSLQYQDLTNSGALHAQDWTHMNDTAILLCPDLKKKEDQPTDSPNFWTKRTNKPFIFLGLIEHYE